MVSCDSCRIETCHSTRLCVSAAGTTVALIQAKTDIEANFELHRIKIEPARFYIKTCRGWLAAREDFSLGFSDENGSKCNVFVLEFGGADKVSFRTCYNTYITAKRWQYGSGVDHSATHKGKHEIFTAYYGHPVLDQVVYPAPPEEEQLPQLRRPWLNDRQKAALAVGGAALTVASAPILVGFSSSGIAAGSVAAAIQSSIGNVAAGSTFATFQSMGATGVFVTSANAAAVTTAAAVVTLADSGTSQPKDPESSGTSPPKDPESDWTSVEAEAAEKECCICLKAEEVGKLLALVPCGHRCVCADCSALVIGKPCPVCRTEARQAIRVFD